MPGRVESREQPAGVGVPGELREHRPVPFQQPAYRRDEGHVVHRAPLPVGPVEEECPELLLRFEQRGDLLVPQDALEQPRGIHVEAEIRLGQQPGHGRSPGQGPLQVPEVREKCRIADHDGPQCRVGHPAEFADEGRLPVQVFHQPWVGGQRVGDPGEVLEKGGEALAFRREEQVAQAGPLGCGQDFRESGAAQNQFGQRLVAGQPGAQSFGHQGDGRDEGRCGAQDVERGGQRQDVGGHGGMVAESRELVQESGELVAGREDVRAAGEHPGDLRQTVEFPDGLCTGLADRFDAALGGQQRGHGVVVGLGEGVQDVGRAGEREDGGSLTDVRLRPDDGRGGRPALLHEGPQWVHSLVPVEYRSVRHPSVCVVEGGQVRVGPHGGDGPGGAEEDRPRVGVRELIAQFL